MSAPQLAVLQGPVYDYDRQRWVSGGTPEANRLHRKQALETLEVIDAPAYRRMMGYNDALAAAIKAGAEAVVRATDECRFCVTAAQYRPGARCEAHR